MQSGHNQMSRQDFIRGNAWLEGGSMPPTPKFMSAQASEYGLFGSGACETYLGKDLKRRSSWS